jgi:hypothetical protein
MATTLVFEISPIRLPSVGITHSVRCLKDDRPFLIPGMDVGVIHLTNYGQARLVAAELARTHGGIVKEV